ncbi:hypothetical protein F5Y05DRAFT_362043 [Hypoxylon sp. FL0543]|nr:hypothetical protein F5Y05DRAFT_362043 [Hypoxylon sp. FL0543]
MSLLRLSTELLCSVIEESMPEGFESLMLSCRHIYKCGKHLIASHNDRKMRWTHLDLDENFHHMSVFDLLHEIAEEPALSRYIESVDLSSWRCRCEPLRGFDLIQRNDTALHCMKSFIEESPYLRKAEGLVPEEWAHGMLFGSIDDLERYAALTAQFFLTLLPNVKTLVLPQFWADVFKPPPLFTHSEDSRLDYQREAWDLMETIRQTAQKGPQGASLGKLAELQLRFPDYDHRGFDLCSLSTLLAMPNLTALRLPNCVATKDDDRVSLSFRWLYPPNINSSLREINLSSSCMDSFHISELLFHTPHLIRFSYNHDIKDRGLGWDWDAGAFIAAVGRHVGSHLEELDVTSNTPFHSAGTGVTSMKEFTKLKILTLDARVFCGTPTALRGKSLCYLRFPEIIYIHRTTEAILPWTIESVPPLFPMLPSTLESLHIHVATNRFWIDPEVVQRLFIGSAVDRPRLLPNLSDLRILASFSGDTMGDEDTIRAYVEPAGALCEFKSLDYDSD